MTPAETQAAVARLHADFCEASGRAVPLLAGFARLWWELLHSAEYGDDAERLGADAAHLVRYLRRQIARDKRNPGSLKLINFLQPDRFHEDLVEARQMMRPARSARAPFVHQPAPGETAAPLEAGFEIAAKLRKFREGIR